MSYFMWPFIVGVSFQHPVWSASNIGLYLLLSSHCLLTVALFQSSPLFLIFSSILFIHLPLSLLSSIIISCITLGGPPISILVIYPYHFSLDITILSNTRCSSTCSLTVSVLILSLCEMLTLLLKNLISYTCILLCELFYVVFKQPNSK